MSCKLMNCSLFAIFLFVTFSAVCESQYGDKPLTDICLGCICEAISGCNQTKACYGEVCGLFHITYAYWKDGGNPTIFNESPESEKAFPNCVTDPQCAATTMQNYMKKFGQDCNEDRVVDCLDYFRIHKLGGYGCRGELDFNQNSKLTNCLAEYDPSRTGSGKVDIRINN